MSDNSGSNTVLAFLLGGAVGAGLALMYSPKSGRENREELTRLMEKLKGQAVVREKKMELKMFRAMDDISSRILEILEDGREFTEARKEELIKAVLDARRSLEDVEKAPSA